MTARSPLTIADLLAVAARVLDQAGELPPLTVGCSPKERFLAPLTLTPASLGMSRDEQAALVWSVAAAMGWSRSRLADVDGGWDAGGTVDGIKVQVMAAPLSSTLELQTRTTQVSTAEHAELLRALIDWSADLPEQTISLQVREDLDNDGVLTARVVLAKGADQAAVSAVPGLVVPSRPDGWSGFRGIGVLPTGHALTVSVGT